MIRADKIMQAPIPCLIVCRGEEVPEPFLQAAKNMIGPFCLLRTTRL